MFICVRLSQRHWHINGSQAQRHHRADHPSVLHRLQQPGLRFSFGKLRTGLEKVYANALEIELRKLGLKVVPRVPIVVYYDGQVIGDYEADLLVADAVIVELKATRTLAPEHEAQLLNDLKATVYEVDLLLKPSAVLRLGSGCSSGQRFGPTPQVVRKVYDNERKGNLSWTKGKS